jgi:hypothetical protein
VIYNESIFLRPENFTFVSKFERWQQKHFLQLEVWKVDSHVEPGDAPSALAVSLIAPS